MARLFVAVWPAEHVVAALDRMPVPDGDDVRPIPHANWHVTLRFVGEADPDAVAALLRSAVLPSADLTFGPAVEWLGPQLVVPVAGADRLAASVRDATASVGDPARHPFRGHLTIARTRHGASSALSGAPFAASMRVTEVALVESSLDPAGAVYTTLATFVTVTPTDASEV